MYDKILQVDVLTGARKDFGNRNISNELMALAMA